MSHPLRILVVDDDPDLRNIVDMVLAKAGYSVTQAAHGVEALVRVGREQFDLVVSDLAWPDLSGFRLLDSLRYRGIGIPVLFLATLTEAEGKMLRSSADYIQKPFRRDAFLDRIRALIPVA